MKKSALRKTARARCSKAVLQAAREPITLTDAELATAAEQAIRDLGL